VTCDALAGHATDGNTGTRHATIKRRPTLNLIHSELNVINSRHWIFGFLRNIRGN
jgi:hypothetical protein